jgi:hypothetical protein
MEPVTLSCWSPELWPEQLAAQCCELGDRGRDVDRGHLGDLMYAASAVIPYLRAKMRSASSSPKRARRSAREPIDQPRVIARPPLRRPPPAAAPRCCS